METTCNLGAIGGPCPAESCGHVAGESIRTSAEAFPKCLRRTFSGTRYGFVGLDRKR